MPQYTCGTVLGIPPTGIGNLHFHKGMISGYKYMHSTFLGSIPYIFRYIYQLKDVYMYLTFLGMVV